jgi:hypothetical protein
MRVMARRTFLALLTFGVLSACRMKPHVGNPQPRTTVTVVNTSLVDMTLYIVSRGQRARLGVALSNKTSEFEIPAYLVFGATPVKFMTEERVRNGAPFALETTICPGDHVQLEIQ